MSKPETFAAGTSVPRWVDARICPDADLSGRAWTVLSCGLGGADIAARWVEQIRRGHGDAEPVVFRVADDAETVQILTEVIGMARVGWRLLLAGPADWCLRSYSHVLRFPVNDDEITVATTDTAVRDVHCPHCQARTRATIRPGETLNCVGCERTLTVQSHVSLRIGAYLGVAS